MCVAQHPSAASGNYMSIASSLSYLLLTIANVAALTFASCSLSNTLKSISCQGCSSQTNITHPSQPTLHAFSAISWTCNQQSAKQGRDAKIWCHRIAWQLSDPPSFLLHLQQTLHAPNWSDIFESGRSAHTHEVSIIQQHLVVL